MSEAFEAPDLSFVDRLAHLKFAVEGVVDGFHTGLHKSHRRGGGLVFSEHRPYRPGDDPRTIDWRAFARSDHHRVKRFEHEAQLRAMLALDVSGSMLFGGPNFGQTKVGFAATLLGACAEVLLRQGDAAGAALFDSEVRRWIPIRGGRAHARVLLEALCYHETQETRTDLAQALSQVERHAGRHGAIVIASDLLDFGPGAFSVLSRLCARGHRVYVLHVLHQQELSLSFDEPLRVLGTEGEPPLEIDPRSIRSAYERELSKFRSDVEAACASAGARYVLAATTRPAAEVLREALGPKEGMRWA